jgi:hypothetical protein
MRNASGWCLHRSNSLQNFLQRISVPVYHSILTGLSEFDFSWFDNFKSSRAKKRGLLRGELAHFSFAPSRGAQGDCKSCLSAPLEIWNFTTGKRMPVF